MVTIRVSYATLNWLEKLVPVSCCRSIGEVARKILNKERINCFYRDVSMLGSLEELALILKELKFIGVKINQQTRYFNVVKLGAEKPSTVGKQPRLYNVPECLVIMPLAPINTRNLWHEDHIDNILDSLIQFLGY